jgi:sorbitol-specific phosphotransferase system component IIBC
MTIPAGKMAPCIGKMIFPPRNPAIPSGSITAQIATDTIPTGTETAPVETDTIQNGCGAIHIRN